MLEFFLIIFVLAVILRVVLLLLSVLGLIFTGR